MTREFPDELRSDQLRDDELLSAFLDDELSPAERAMVEKHLAAHEADRLLLAELKALRGEVQALPGVSVRPDFTERVVKAAIAAAENHDRAATTVGWAAPTTGETHSPRHRSRRRNMIRAAVASAAALAACFLLIVQPWRRVGPVQPGLPEIVAALPNPLVQSLHAAIPAADETVVLRLKAGKDVPLAQALDEALAKSGIAPLGSEYFIGAAELETAYRKALDAKHGSTGGPTGIEATLAAAQAVFIEAPLMQLEGALTDLAAGFQQPLNLDAQGKLAFVRMQNVAEGEPGSSTKKPKLPPAGQPFAQRLDASQFRLEKSTANAALNQQPVAAAIDPQQLVRVLLLIE